MQMDQHLTGESFDFATFKSRLAGADLTPTQLVPLLQRCQFLKASCGKASENRRRRKRGQSTLVPTGWTRWERSVKPAVVQIDGKALTRVKM